MNEVTERINERLIIEGDGAICAKYLPFARNQSLKIKAGYSLLTSIGLKTYTFSDAEVQIKFVLGRRWIKIKSLSKAGYAEGILRYCDLLEKDVSSYYPKIGTTADPRSWRNLKNFGLAPTQNIINIGFPYNPVKTFHTIQKASNYSGVIRYAVQILMSFNKKIGYNYSFYETDGLLLEKVQFKGEFVNGFLQSWVDRYDFRLIKVCTTGIYIKTASNSILPEWVKKIPATFTEKLQPNEFYTKLNESTFEIPATLTDNPNKDGVYRLPVDLSNFYSKNPHFESCGWLMPYGSEAGQTANNTIQGSVGNRVFHLYNTCKDDEKSYLYCIQVKQNTIYFSEQYKATSAYTDNPLYVNKTHYVTYTAELKLLKEGFLSCIKQYYPWLNGNEGLYIPDVSDVNVKPCVLGSTGRNVLTSSNVDNYTPLYVYGSPTQQVRLVTTMGTLGEPSEDINALEKSIIVQYASKYVTTIRNITVPVNYITLTLNTYSGSPRLPSLRAIRTTNVSNGVTIEAGRITLTNASGKYICIPNFEREAIIETDKGAPSLIDYEVRNGVLQPLVFPDGQYAAADVYIYSRTQTLGGFAPIPSINYSAEADDLQLTVKENLPFKLDLVNDVFSNYSGYFRGSTALGNIEYCFLDGKYPETNLPNLTFLGRPKI